MKILACIGLLLLSFSSFSQKNSGTTASYPIDGIKSRCSFQKTFVGNTNSERVKAHLLQTTFRKGVALQLLHRTESPQGIHFTYQQMHQGIPIYRGVVKVNMDRQGYIRSILDHSFPIHTPLSKAFPSLKKIRTTDGATTAISEPVYFYDGKHLVPAMLTTSNQSDAASEMIEDNSGTLLYERDLCSYAPPGGQDSLVSARVFLPDPLTTAGVSYGAPYIDDGDTDVAELLAELVDTSFTATFENDTFKLESPYILITEHSPPVTPVTYNLSPSFNFNRSHPQFEDVNAFYHLNTFQAYIQSLGFNNLVNYQLHVDAHGYNGSDNSGFIPTSNPPRLIFGEGGVDDAEDADVIIHEYGHAISESAAPGSNSGNERKALDEGNGDYLASSYSRSINPFQWENVFSWDGHNEFWNGRNSATSKLYPQDMVGNIYFNGEIWSSTLMEIWGDIGREATDKLLLQSMYSYSVNMTFSDAASLFILADSLCNGGANYTAINNRFVNRGIIPFVGVEEHATSHIELRGSNVLTQEVTIAFTHPSSGTMQLYNTNGQLISSSTFQQQLQLQVNGLTLPRGVYLLTIITKEETTTFKLVR